MVPTSLPRTVQVDGLPVVLRTRYHVMQHKPRGVVTALRDRRHPTAYALLGERVPMLRDLRAVGRLDLDTSGLLLWTTEGALLHRLTHPRYAVPRVYQAALAGPWTSPPPELVLDDGHRPLIHQLAPLPADERHPALHVPDAATDLATITLSSGKFHEVRRIFAALGSRVVGLCRVSFGSLELPRDLDPGAHRFVDLHARFSGLHPRPSAPASAVRPAEPA